MTPGELFDRVRDDYVERLSREITDQRAAGRTVIAEPAYRDAEGNLVREGPLDLPARRSWHPLARWFSAWIPTEEEGEGPELLGSVHYMSEPEVNGPIVRLAVDLGSAPVEALGQLFDAAEEAGATKLAIGAA